LRGILVDQDSHGEFYSHNLFESRGEPLRITLLKPVASELVLYPDNKHPIVGEFNRCGVFEPSLETRGVELIPDDIQHKRPYGVDVSDGSRHEFSKQRDERLTSRL
jgi:hypothetical protein